MGKCYRCGGFSEFSWGLCPACIRADIDYERQQGTSKSSDSDGCGKVFAGVIVIMVVVMIFHAPSAWFAHKAYEIDWFDAIRASMECSEGWYGATLTWSAAAVLVWAIYSIIAQKVQPVIMVPVVIFSGFTTWYVWSHLEVIKDSHDSRKAQATAKAENMATAEGYKNESENRATESGSGPAPQVNRVWTAKDGREIDATFVKIENEVVYFKMSGSEADFGIPFHQLTTGDQVIAKTLQATSVSHPRSD